MLSIIVAMDPNRVIGNQGRLPWNLPEDLQHFKQATQEKTVIMGRKTFQSIGRPLPNRVNIVMSSTLQPQEGVVVCKSMVEALEKAKQQGKDIFVIGGSRVYEAALPLADQLIISHVKQSYEGDTLFPKFDASAWKLVQEQEYPEFTVRTYTGNIPLPSQELQEPIKPLAFSAQERTAQHILSTSQSSTKATFVSTSSSSSLAVSLAASDPEVQGILKSEEGKQQNKISLIPSENFFSPAVRQAVGSVFMHKYSEGNVGRRYYEGNQFIDAMETLTIQRAKKAFKLPDDWGVNVQALSGSNANLAVYLALLNVGDTIMGMYLPDGGHLSHGWSYEPQQQQNPNELTYHGGSRKVNITSRIFKTIQYKTDPSTQLFNYEEIEKIALEHKPKLIITGGTAYPREIDYARMKEIAQKVGAYYLADIAHEAGLISAGAMKSPVGIADVVTMTTHKTLRSGRGALILAHQDMIKKINRAVLPGMQGGPFNNNIAGICVGLGEALKPEFKEYANQVVRNAQYLSRALQEKGFTLVSGGTDKHLVLINLSNQLLLGKKFARALDYAGLITNYNTMPQETRPPLDPSALRIGTPWATTRGMKEEEMQKIAEWIKHVLDICSVWKDLEFPAFEEMVKASIEVQRIADEVKELCGKFVLHM
jgi:glycine hydroxymethyltransferase